MHLPQLTPPAQKANGSNNPANKGKSEVIGFGQIGTIHTLQKTLGNKHVEQLVRSKIPPKQPVSQQPNPTVQRKIEFADNKGVPSMKAFNRGSAWLNHYQKVMKHRLENLPAYKAFYQSPHVTIYIDVANVSPTYMAEVNRLLSVDPNTVNGEVAENRMSAEKCRSIAPNVVTASTTSFIMDQGDQTVIFRDRDVTLEEGIQSNAKAKLVFDLVAHAKTKIQTVLSIMEQLTASNRIGGESERFEEVISRILNIEEFQILAGAFQQLSNIFQIMHNRLSASVLEVSTMDRSATYGERTVKGKSHPKEGGHWILDSSIKGANNEAWVEWLKRREDFGGSIQMRIDTDHVVHRESVGRIRK